MKDFTLASRMLTLRGEFYPTGFVFVMMPTVDDARAVERGLLAAGFQGDDMLLLKTEDVLEKVVPTAAHHGETFPSVGTESATVLKYRALALKGHCAMMVRAASGDTTEKVMKVVRTVPFSIAEKYRFLVIEDLE
jgi:hypothetical protein